MWKSVTAVALTSKILLAPTTEQNLEDRQQTVKENKDCNCQQKQKCPLNNKC